MSSRALAALGLLLAASAAERYAYWGMHAFVTADRMRAPSFQSVQSVQSTSSFFMWIAVLGFVLGAGLAYAIGPRIAAVVSLVVVALGLFGLWVGISPLTGGGIAAIGAAMFRLCPYAAAVELFAREDGEDASPSPRRFAGLSAFATGMAVAVNVATMLAPSGFSFRSAPSPSSCGLSTVVALVGTVFAGASIVIAPSKEARAPMPAQTPYRGSAALAPTPSHSSPSKSLRGVALLAALTCLWWAGMSIGSRPPLDRPAWIYSVSSLSMLAATAIAFVLWIVAATTRWSGTPVRIYGIGLAVFGVGLGFIATGPTTVLHYAVGAVITSVGAAALPIGIAYAALSIRGWAVSFVLAGWFVLSTLSSIPGRVLLRQTESVRTVELFLFCCLCVGAGAAVIAAARWMQRTFFDAAPSSSRH